MCVDDRQGQDEDEEGVGEDGEGDRVSEGTTMTYLLNGRAVTMEELDGMSRYPQWWRGAS